jgi:hypothetical protein
MGTHKETHKLFKKYNKYFSKHRDELVEKYNGKYIVIKNNTVLGAYDDEIEAIENTQKIHELGTFMVKKCIPEKDEIPRIFHSPLFATERKGLMRDQSVI